MIIVILLFVTILVLWFIYKPIKQTTITNFDANIALNKIKQKELQDDLNNNLINKVEFLAATEEIKQNLAQELITEDNKKTSINSHIVAIISALFIIISSLTIYYYLSPQSSLFQALYKENNLDLLPNNSKKIQQYLQTNPNDNKAWHKLGLSFSIEDKLTQARDAYAKAYELGNKEIDLLTEYAGILAVLNNGHFTELAIKLVQEALEVDANSIKALYLFGIIAANDNKFDLAKNIWQKALSLSEKNSEYSKLLEYVLQQINNTPSVEISIIIDIETELLKQRFNDYLMVYAKKPTGPPMPIAIKKIKLKDFIGKIILNDNDSIMPTNKLSQVENVVIIARISKSGSAMRDSSDKEVTSEIIKVKDNPTVELKIYE